MGLSLSSYEESELTSGEKTFINRTKAIYNNLERSCFLYVQPRVGQLEPDFILVDPFKGVLIVEVKDWSIDYIVSINQKTVRLGDGRQAWNPSNRSNQYLRKVSSLLKTDLALQSDDELCFPLVSKVFFPNITSDQLKKDSQIKEVLNQYPVEILTSNLFRNCNPQDLFGDTTLSIDEGKIDRIRSLLFPEITINISRGSIHSEMEEPPVLEPKQEELYKRKISGHYLSTGIPGSGKTKILLARALYIARQRPNWRILILTYTRSLANRLKHQLENHEFSDSQIKSEVKYEGNALTKIGATRALVDGAFMQLQNGSSDELKAYLKEEIPAFSDSKNKELVEAATNYFCELYQNVIEKNDQNLIDDFLSKSNRHKWTANIEVSTFSSFAKNLSGLDFPSGIDSSAADDWWNHIMPKAALEQARPMFDSVLVDEYQDFHEDWFRLCKRICRVHSVGNSEKSESLWFAGDQLQSIYVSKPQSWASVGLSVVGRSTFIKKTYRASSAHIALAMRWLRAEEEIANEVKKFYPEDGYSPKVRKNDEIEFLTGSFEVAGKRCKELLKYYKPGEILVLCPNRKVCTKFFEVLPESVRKSAQITKDTGFDDTLIITTYWSSKGLESKVAILVDIDGISRISHGNSSNVIQRKLIYVGLTRASEKLLIHAQSSGGKYYEDLRDLGKDI